MIGLPDVEWPEDLRCGECGAIVGDDGAKIHYASLVVPREPELYAWCCKHKPKTEEEEDELWQRVKNGDLREQAQSWEDY
jgi:hypothetical protein